MSRCVPWRNKCPEVVNVRIEQALRTPMYLVQETGPTGFILKEASNAEQRFRVCVGPLHSCTCSLFLKEKELCKHLLWIIIKKLKVDKNSPLAFQKSWIEREICDILQNETIISVQVVDKKPPEFGSQKSGNIVVQRIITKDDVCPICQDPLLENGKEPILFCKYSCGNNLHMKCMKMVIDHQTKVMGKSDIQCPLCRHSMGSVEDLLKEYSELTKQFTREERSKIHSGFTCSNCNSNPIIGSCYRCKNCEGVYLCHSCFVSPEVHSEHMQFMVRTRKRCAWQQCQRPKNSMGLADTIVNDLQNRELTDHDYEQLLSLDNPSIVSGKFLLHLIHELPVKKYLPKAETLGKKDCFICKEKLSVGTLIRKLPCSHFTFHQKCIDRWLLRHPNCPQCDNLVYTTISGELPTMLTIQMNQPIFKFINEGVSTRKKKQRKQKKMKKLKESRSETGNSNESTISMSVVGSNSHFQDSNAVLVLPTIDATKNIKKYHNRKLVNKNEGLEMLPPISGTAVTMNVTGLGFRTIPTDHNSTKAEKKLKPYKIKSKISVFPSHQPSNPSQIQVPTAFSIQGRKL